MVFVSLTDAGLALVERVEAVWEQLERSTTDGLSPKQQALIVNLADSPSVLWKQRWARWSVTRGRNPGLGATRAYRLTKKATLSGADVGPPAGVASSTAR